MLAAVVLLLTTLLTLTGLLYFAVALFSIRRHRLQPVPPASGWTPTVSILKPVKGSDPGLLASFASHCTQIYAGRWELLLGASEGDTTDLAVLADRLHEQYPSVPVRVIPCTERLGINGKVSTLRQMLPSALGEVIVVNDADIRVPPDYLQNVVDTLAVPGTGLVTALYRGQVSSGGTLWSRLEALGLSTDFLPGVLLATWVERGVHFAFGSTLALRRSTLDRIEGFQPLQDYLADDYQLHREVARAGLATAIVPTIVTTTVPPYTIRAYLDHQLRWMRTVRDARGWGYLGLVVGFALPWALANVIASGAALWSISLLSLVLLARVTVALAGGVGLLRDGQVFRDLPLLPIRDILALFIWAWGYASDNIVWRGERMRVQKGILHPLK